MNVSDMKRDRDGFIRLTPKFSSLYQRTNYRSPISLVVNTITEYDLKSANISALRASGKVPEEILTKLAGIQKIDREKAVGRMIKQNPKIHKIIARGICNAKMQLFVENGITDNDILSIKNDAVFIIGRKLSHMEFGPYKFVPKHTYSAYLYLDPMIEIYYDGRRRTVTFKGISDDIVAEDDHQKGMVQFLSTVMQYVASGRRDKLKKYLIDFVQRYKSKDLPVEYYRELNPDNVYRTDISIETYGYNVTIASESYKPIVNGVYNYTRYILPIVQAFMG